MPLSNYKITQITSNPTRELVGFYNNGRLFRFVSVIQDVSLSEDGLRIVLQSSGLPSFEFDVYAISDIDGTAYTPLSNVAGRASELYRERISDILAQLLGIFKGCCSTSSGGGGQDPIQWQDEGVNVGAAGQYTKINLTGDVTATQTAIDTLEIDVTGGGGGGSGRSYYLNGSVVQGTFAGIADMRQISPVPIIGTGTDFTISSNGYIKSFITDAGDPNKAVIPAGNWNFELWFSASSGGGSPSFYVELSKYDTIGGTFTAIATSSAVPEGITNGTTIDLYFTALSVPQTTLLVTDRLAIRVFVNNGGGSRTITLHTQGPHLSQIITDFASGIVSLNGLTAFEQNFGVGTAGTDFGISSAAATHTFNLPTASATNRGALSSADWTTFNNKVPSARTLTINGVSYDLSADRSWVVSGGQTPIQWQDEGIDLGSSGTVNEVDLVGQIMKGTRAVNKLTITAPSVGENLQMNSLDPSNPLNVDIGALIINAVVWSPAAGKHNNVSIAGWNDTWDASTGTGKATLISFEGADYAILSGVVGGAIGRRMIIHNNSNELLIIENESTSSVSANRLSFEDGTPMFLMPNRSVEFIYNGGKWRAINPRKFDLFDDFIASNNLGGTFNGVAFSSFYAFATGASSWGTAPPSQSNNQLGSISASPAIDARNGISTVFNAGYGGSGVNVPVLSVYKIAFSATPAGTKRIALGYGNFGAASGVGGVGYYTGNVLQCGFGYASDSLVANAATNWFLYHGAGGAVNIAANGLDTGIPVSQAVNNFCVFVVWLNPTTGVMKAFYSSDRMAYSFVGTRTGAASNLSLCLWYGAYGTAAPTLYCDYVGSNTKIDTNR
jgi:hypothetical protein